MRYHFEKSKDDKWDKTTSRNNIKNLVSITDQQVFKHQNQSLCLSTYEKKRIANGVLKESCFNLLSNLSNPEYYKSNEIENENKSLVLPENKNQSEINKQIKTKINFIDSDEEYEDE
jgi:hypothetical protein